MWPFEHTTDYAQQPSGSYTETNATQDASVLSTSEQAKAPQLSKPPEESILVHDDELPATKEALTSRPQPSETFTVAPDLISEKKGVNNFTPLLNQALSKTVHWLNNPGNMVYTIQIMSTEMEEKSKLEEFLKSYSGQQHGKQLFILPISSENQTLYAVTYGGFSHYQSAKEQLEALPDAMKRFNPYIKTISSLRLSIQ